MTSPRVGTRLYLFSLDECEAAKSSNGKVVCKYSNVSVALRDVAPDIALSDLEGIVIDFQELETSAANSIGVSAEATVYKAKYRKKIHEGGTLRNHDGITQVAAMWRLRNFTLQVLRSLNYE